MTCKLYSSFCKLCLVLSVGSIALARPVAAETLSNPNAKHVYAITQVDVVPGKHKEFVELLKKNIPIIRAGGVRLVGSYTITVGALYKVIDVWEGPDIASLHKALFASAASEESTYSSILRGELAEYAELTLPEIDDKVP